VVILVPVFAPLVLLLALGIPALLSQPLREPFVGRLVRLVMAAVFFGNAIALVAHALSGGPAELVSLGFELPAAMGAFAFDFLVDSKALAFGALSALLCGIVAAFSNRYLHRDPGFNRYFVLFAAFVLGIQLVALAGSIEVLIAGWELLGLSSALLVGFFHDRRAPVENAFRVFAVYRIGDVAMLSAAVLLHQTAGSGSLLMLFSSSSGTMALPAGRATLIALLLLVAVAAKSALFPLSGWLPRAMEGPTPSSAVYYGAVSIHAGCFLLLRASPVLEQSLPAQVLAAVAGLTTAVYATMSARVQADLKSALAYDALTHVGLIVVEIALGLETIAFLHTIVHMSFRLMQFLSAPNVLHDLHGLGVEVRPRTFPLSGGHSPGLYLFALERGFLDALADRAVVVPFRKLASALDAMDQNLCGRRGPAGIGIATGELKND
jgi:NAD(P)H-quinone oxidoreductase subunit 5